MQLSFIFLANRKLMSKLGYLLPSFRDEHTWSYVICDNMNSFSRRDLYCQFVGQTDLTDETKRNEAFDDEVRSDMVLDDNLIERVLIFMRLIEISGQVSDADLQHASMVFFTMAVDLLDALS